MSLENKNDTTPIKREIVEVLTKKASSLDEILSQLRDRRRLISRCALEDILNDMVEFGYVSQSGEAYQLESDFNMYACENDALDLFLVMASINDPMAYIRKVLHRLDNEDQTKIAVDQGLQIAVPRGKDSPVNYILKTVRDMYEYVDDHRGTGIEDKMAVAQAILISRPNINVNTLKRLYKYMPKSQQPIYMAQVLDSAVCNNNKVALDWVISMKNTCLPDLNGLDLAMEHAEVRGNTEAYKLLKKEFQPGR